MESDKVGNRVCFVGGPEAGNVRIISDSVGDHVMADNDYCYRIWPMKTQGDNRTLFFAYAADQHPLQMYLDMWREYAPSAQIKRSADIMTYQRVVKNSP